MKNIFAIIGIFVASFIIAFIVSTFWFGGVEMAGLAVLISSAMISLGTTAFEIIIAYSVEKIWGRTVSLIMLFPVAFFLSCILLYLFL